VQQSRRHDPSTVDQDADHFSLCFGQSAIGGAGRRRQSGLDSDQSKVASKRRNDRGIERGRRAVVDDDDFVICRIDVPLVVRREGEKGSGRLARDVVDDNDDRQGGHTQIVSDGFYASLRPSNVFLLSVWGRM
jgi:hypothetical protein